MTSTELAKKMNTTRASVLRAVRDGLIDPKAYRWKGKRGGRRTLEIINPALAMRHWLPRTGIPTADGEAEQGADLADGASAGEARRVREIYLARQAKLEFEKASGLVIDTARAMEIYGRQIQEAKTKIMALGKLARSRIPHLTVDDALLIEDLCREALEEVATKAIRGDAPAGGKS